MILSLTSSAITAALNSAWEEAISLNEKILAEEPKDIAALNRLAYAYLEMGKMPKAQKYYKQVLELDPYNPIALKNLKRIKEFPSSAPRVNYLKSNALASVFLEEPGKTRIVNGVKLATKSLLSRLRTGDPLELIPKKHYISLNDQKGNYIASLPDDLSFRLLDFIKKGNIYEIYVRSVSKNSLLLFIREIFRSNKMKNVASFCQKADISDIKYNSRPPKEEMNDDNSQESGEDKEE